MWLHDDPPVPLDFLQNGDNENLLLGFLRILAHAGYDEDNEGGSEDEGDDGQSDEE